MAYDIKMVKLVSGELVIGKYAADAAQLTDVAIMQTVPAQSGVQIMLLPYGYPFDQEFTGKIDKTFFMFEYGTLPQEIQDKYLEAVSKLTLSSGGIKGVSKSGLII